MNKQPAPHDQAISPNTQSSNSPLVTRRGFLHGAALGAGTLAAASATALVAPAEEAQAAIDPDSDTWKDCLFDFELGSGKKFMKDGNVFDFEFHHSWFSEKSFDYNPRLARFAIAMAIASFGLKDDLVEVGKYPDQSTAPYKNQDICLDDFFRQMTRDGNSEKNATYRHNDDLVGPTGHDTIGLGACTVTIPARDEAASADEVVTYRRTNLVLLAVRGGNYFLEWCGNLKAGRSGDHEGFTIAAQKTVAFLKGYIKEMGLTGRTKVLISGFSRASATATMAGGLLLREAQEQGLDYDDANDRGFNLGALFGDGVEMYQSDLFAYGFEVPRGLLPGSSSLDAQVNARKHGFQGIHCIVNPCDPVTYVMPSAWGFETFGTTHRLPGPTSASYGEFKDVVAARLKDLYLCKFTNPADDLRIRRMSPDTYLPMLFKDVACDLVGSREAYAAIFQDLGIDFMQEITKRSFSFGDVVSKWGDEIKDYYLDILKNITWNKSKWLLLFPPAYLAYVTGRITAELAWTVTDLFSGKLAQQFIDMFCDTMLKSVSCDGKNPEGVAAVEDIRAQLKKNMHLNGNNPLLLALRFLLKHPMYLTIAVLKISWLATWLSKQVFGSADMISGDLLTIDFGHLMDAHSPMLAASWMQAECELGAAPQAASLSAESALASLGEGEGDAGSEQATDAVRALTIVDGDFVRYIKDSQTAYDLFDAGKRLEDDATDEATGDLFTYTMSEDGEKLIIMGGADTLNFYVESDSEFSVSLATFDAATGDQVAAYSYRDVNTDGVGSYVLEVGVGSLKVYNVTEAGGAGDEVDAQAVQMSGSYVTTPKTNGTDEEPRGVVVGGGTTQAGTYELLAAVPCKGYEFDCWSIDGEKLDRTPEYALIDADCRARSSHFQHYVDADRTVTANFRPYTEIGEGDGAGQTVVVGTAKELTFRCGTDVASFLRVEIDEVELAADAYTVTGNGSETVVTLKDSYVASLAEGSYKAAIISADGDGTRSAATLLTVVAKGADEGDGSNGSNGNGSGNGVTPSDQAGVAGGSGKKGAGAVPATGEADGAAGIAAAAVAGAAAVIAAGALGDADLE